MANKSSASGSTRAFDMQEIRNKAVKRAQLYSALFVKFKAILFPNYKSIRCHPAILKVALKSYFLDVERLKEFHHIDFADRHKRAGFTYKWLCKMKPVFHIDSDTPNLTKKELLVNELFAVFLAISHLDIKKIDVVDLEPLIYGGFYRDMKGEEWSLMMYFFEKACNCK